MMRSAVLVALVGWVGLAQAQDLPGAAPPAPSDVEAVQRRLSDAKCYAGPIDGQSSPALKQAGDACPDQQPVLRIETGTHAAAIGGISADTQCRIIATGAHDKTVRLWTPDGRLVRTVRLPIAPGDVGKVYAVAVSPDGRWVAAGGFLANEGDDEAIFLFDSTAGQSARRLGGSGIFGEVIENLAFSPDGRRIAASLGSGAGVRILDVRTGAELSSDKEYGGKSANGVSFAPDGSLFAVGEDGFVRRYGPDGLLMAKVRTAHPKALSVSVEPSGRRVAVSSAGIAAVDLYDAETLVRVGAANVSGVSDGDLGRVSWSGDGSRLFAGGSAGTGERKRISVWTAEGKTSAPPVDAAGGAITALRPCGDGVVYAASDASFGRIGPEGEPIVFAQGRAPDTQPRIEDAFTVSADGKRVRFGLTTADDPVLFDLSAASLVASPALPDDLSAPQVNGLPVTDWRGGSVRFEGAKMTLKGDDVAHALAVRPDNDGFVIAGDNSLHAFDSNGDPVWSPVESPATPLGVNIARDGDVIVAYHADGTVRWLRWRDGQELLALFVDRDTKRWAAWTPSGYYAASAGGEDLIGWHVNRGWAQPADFFPASKFRDVYARPDVVARVLDTLDETDALAEANAARANRLAAGKSKPVAEPPVLPVVSIASPIEGAQVAQEEVRVDYFVRSPTGLSVDAVDVLVDGLPADAVQKAAQSGTDADELRDCLVETGGMGRAEDRAQGCRGSVVVRVPVGASEVTLQARSGTRVSEAARIRLQRIEREAPDTKEPR